MGSSSKMAYRSVSSSKMVSGETMESASPSVVAQPRKMKPFLLTSGYSSTGAPLGMPCSAICSPSTKNLIEMYSEEPPPLGSSSKIAYRLVSSSKMVSGETMELASPSVVAQPRTMNPFLLTSGNSSTGAPLGMPCSAICSPSTKNLIEMYSEEPPLLGSSS